MALPFGFPKKRSFSCPPSTLLYENGSRQIIQSIVDAKIWFRSGLVLSKEDGRVRQGDVVTTYKSQGASKLDMIRFEDNQSLSAMAGQEDLHVGFTRHRATAKMFVESVEVLREIASRSCQDRPAAVRLTQSESEHVAALWLLTLHRAVVDGLRPRSPGFGNESSGKANVYPQRSLPTENRDLFQQNRFKGGRNRSRQRPDTERLFTKQALEPKGARER
jgi:hypothetical protein